MPIYEVSCEDFLADLFVEVMELRRIGDVLLRSRASPLLPFLAPSIPSAWLSLPSHGQLLTATTKTPLCPRRFVSCTSSPQASSPAAALHPEEDEDNPPLEPSNGNPASDSQPAPGNSRLELVDKLVDETLSGRTPVTAHTRTSRFKSPSAQAENRRETSADAAKSAWEVFAPRSDRDRRNSSFDTSKMLTPNDPSSLQSISDSMRSSLVKRNVPLAPRTIRLSPSVGRSVEVDPNKGVNFAAGLTKLDIILKQNKVKSDFNKQRFHERPGLKRKRLKSERWRRRFKDGFKAIISKVETMRRQGW